MIATPFGSPVTSIGDATRPFVIPPQLAWYAVTDDEPGSLGGENDTLAVPLADAPAFTSLGAPGFVPTATTVYRCVTDAGFPALSVAATVNRCWPSVDVSSGEPSATSPTQDAMPSRRCRHRCSPR